MAAVPIGVQAAIFLRYFFIELLKNIGVAGNYPLIYFIGSFITPEIKSHIAVVKNLYPKRFVFDQSIGKKCLFTQNS